MDNVATHAADGITVFVVNPVSGRRSGSHFWKLHRDRIRSSGLRFSEEIVNAPGAAAEVTRKAILNGAGRVVAVGGDGTLNEVVNGYLDSSGAPINPETEIGLIPAGTGSDFCRSIGVTGFEQAMSELSGANVKTIDAGLIEQHDSSGRPYSRFFANLVSFGLGGRVSHQVNEWNRMLSRRFSAPLLFNAAAIKGLAGYKTRNVTIRMAEGKPITAESDLLVVANGRFGGSGMMLAPSAELDDGLFDVVVTDQAGRMDVIRELPRIRRGLYILNPKVKQYRSKEVTIEAAEPMAVDVDGETGGFTPASLRILPGVLRFCFPR